MEQVRKLLLLKGELNTQQVFEYSKEVEELHEKGVIKEQTLLTYVNYADYFIRWIKGYFEPGAKNKGTYQRNLSSD
ncbi:hypothetical protein [Desulfotomaculum nigrificans]|uniref:hypothetical protein n=1 Tax=Desulfotomaculum nigrificans TaxID=1565 RepID=UPI0001FAECEC|nr:hypothetical protein [Desulfotomaculum nigrificans]